MRLLIAKGVSPFLLLFLLLTPTTQAGVYNSAEDQMENLHPDFQEFRITLVELKKMGVDLDLANKKYKYQTPARKRALLAATLAEKSSFEDLSSDQRMNLGAYLIRLNRPNKAVALLKEFERLESLKARDLNEGFNFLIRANLVTAYHLAGQIDRALITQLGLLRKTTWPEKWEDLSDTQKHYFEQIGWDKDTFRWYRRVENYYQKLLKSRYKEAQQARTNPRFIPEHVDPLFGTKGEPVLFQGENGKYQAGKIAAKEEKLLPKDALAIVQQLLIWLPNDQRLYWQLGELYNAKGDIAAADLIFRQLVEVDQLRYKDLVRHRSVLISTPPPKKKSIFELGGQKIQTTKPDQQDKKATAQKSDDSYPSIVSWQFFGIGFAAGAIVALFSYFQMREFHRRSKKKASQPPPNTSEGHRLPSREAKPAD